MPAITIHLPQPCHESWAAMAPAPGGRHCAACQQVVVDFTAMTDAQLVAYLGRAGKVPCGRFRSSQLGRALQPVAVSAAGWRRWLGAVAALLGLGALATPARAQQGHPAKPAAMQSASHSRKAGKPVHQPHRAAYHRPPQLDSIEPEPVILGGEPIIQSATDSLYKPKN